MPRLELTRSVTVELDGIAGIDELEAAALGFARSAPGMVVAQAVEAMVEDLVGEVCGPFGLPIADDEQIEAPWACPGCGSKQGFRRRGRQVRRRKLTSQVGVIEMAGKMVSCRRCDKRFAPIGQLIGLAPRQRRTEGLATAASALAVEVAYAKASRLLAEVGGVSLSARSIRRDLLKGAPLRLGPPEELEEVPVLLLDGTGERAGKKKNGVELHLAVGIVARKQAGKRTVCQVELLGATLGEGWGVLFDLIGHLRPGLVVVDGEEELSTLCAKYFPTAPRQRCLWHLARAMVRLARYNDGVGSKIVDQAAADLQAILDGAWVERDLSNALECLDLLADNLELDGAKAAATHLRNARDEIFTFLSNPQAGTLVAGHKGRPEVGTGVLERVMREMNRRSDVGVRWSVEGVRRLLMTKLEHKYRRGRWAQSEPPSATRAVRISLTDVGVHRAA